jgi:predicted dehydrogenase
VSTPLRGGAPTPERGSRYRVAIIGAGRRGERRGGAYGIAEAHAGGYVANGERCEIVAAADINEENLGFFCEDYRIPGRYADYREMLERERPDIVSVCTWPQLHAEMTIAAARAGAKGVLCEKPMALTLPDCDAMLAAGAESGTRLSIDHQRRLGEPFRVAKEIARGGDIGELLRVEMYVTGSNMYDWGTHWLDMMRFYLDEEPAEWVFAQVDAGGGKVNWGMRLEQHSVTHVQFRNGVRGYLEIGVPIHGQAPNRLVGSDGFVELLPPDPENPERPTVRARVKGKGDWLVPPSTETIHARINFARAVGDLIRAIDERHDSELSGRRARAVTELILAAFESALRRARVDLPLQVDGSPLDELTALADAAAPPGRAAS